MYLALSGGVIRHSCKIRDRLSGAVISHNSRVRGGVSGGVNNSIYGIIGSISCGGISNSCCRVRSGIRLVLL